jgi:DNA-binding transcriptional LysR family regulator
MSRGGRLGMITLRQLEALYWIVQLGTFERAAVKLNTTQSAISKRIQELEAACRVTVFDRDRRGAKLTEKGEHVLALGQEMLGLQERILDLRGSKEMPARRLRLGVTELSALTWLPRLVTALRDAYPTLTIEPEVDMSRTLHERLREDAIDLIVIPETFSDPEITSVPLAEVANAWMARPDLVTRRGALTLTELADYPILVQGGKSGSGLYFNKWLKSEGIAFTRTLTCDSMMAMLGLTVAGVGISYLPRQCFRPLFAAGKLVVIPTRPALPSVPYAAMYRNDRPSAFTSVVAELARQVCDFSRQFQG